MDITPESKEQIKTAKQKQKDIILECDNASADVQGNISVLQEALSKQNEVRKQAQDTLAGLDSDFPDVTDTLVEVFRDAS